MRLKNEVKNNLQIKFRPELFWDVDPKTVNPDLHKKYIIERIMDFGNDEEVRWMWRHYPKEILAEVVDKSRVIHNSSRSLWRLMTQAT